MNTRKKRWVLPLLLVLLVFGSGVALAGGRHDRTIGRGSKHIGDIEVISDDFDIEEEASVRGDITVFGGDAKIAGTIDGDLFVMGGDVELLESAEISGECVLIGGEMENLSSADCTSVLSGDFELGNFITAPTPPNAPQHGDFHTEHSDASFGGAIFSTILLGVFGFFVASVAPRRMERMSEAVSVKPVVVGTVGFLTLLATIAIAAIVAILTGLLIIILIGLLGIPVLIAIVGLLAVSLLVGWVAVGRIVGETVTDALRLHKVSPAMTVALGTAALTFGIGLLKLLPLVGFSGDLVSFFIAVIGLGSVVLTRFGALTYPRIVAKKVEDQIIFADEKQFIFPDDDELVL